MNRIIACSALLAASLFCIAAARAEVNIDWADVGDPGNAADAATGYGGVAYEYSTGAYEVTKAQYTDFLNAKATVGDPLGLYHPGMAGDGGILRTGDGTPQSPWSYATTGAAWAAVGLLAPRALAQ